MKCLHCQGNMKKGTAPFHLDRKGYHILLDSVAAWVCEQCGEAFLEEAEVDAIQEFVRAVEKKAEALTAAC